MSYNTRRTESAVRQATGTGRPDLSAPGPVPSRDRAPQRRPGRPRTFPRIGTDKEGPQLGLRLPARLRAALEVMAQESGRGLSALCRELLAAGIEAEIERRETEREAVEQAALDRERERLFAQANTVRLPVVGPERGR